MILPMLVQPIFVTIMFAWGKAHPVFGGAMGGLLGMGLAAYAGELLTFLLGLWLYQRVGYNARILFLAHFDWDVVKTSFKFGVFEMLGSARLVLRAGGGDCHHTGTPDQLRRDLGKLGPGTEFYLRLQCNADPQ